MIQNVIVNSSSPLQLLEIVCGCKNYSQLHPDIISHLVA